MQKKIVKYAFTFLKGKDKNKGTKENIYWNTSVVGCLS
jgi:hypothetical protein